MNTLATRDKIELVIAGLIVLVWIVGFELLQMGGRPTWPTRIIVMAAALTMFGDNIAKARSMIPTSETEDE